MVDQTINRPVRPASNPVDEVLYVHGHGGDLIQTASGKWAAKDRNGIIVVRGAPTMGDAARQYVESLGGPAKPTASTPDAILAGIKAEYAPYDAMPEFQEGFDAWPDLRLRRGANPYNLNSINAQAWDRGVDAAARYTRAISAGQRDREGCQ